MTRPTPLPALGPNDLLKLLIALHRAVTSEDRHA